MFANAATVFMQTDESTLPPLIVDIQGCFRVVVDTLNPIWLRWETSWKQEERERSHPLQTVLA